MLLYSQQHCHRSSISESHRQGRSNVQHVMAARDVERGGDEDEAAAKVLEIKIRQVIADDHLAIVHLFQVSLILLLSNG